MLTFSKCENEEYIDNIPIHEATTNKNEEIFKILLDASKESVFIKDPNFGYTLIHNCVFDDCILSIDLFKFLIKRKKV
jgi:hypothetical protein